MSLAVTDAFTWFYSEGGCKWHAADLAETWVDGTETNDVDSVRPVLVDQQPLVEYRPLVEHTGLFLRFARLAPTQTAIREFADRFGALGVGVPSGLSNAHIFRREPPLLRTWIYRHDAPRAEPLEYWLNEIAEMQWGVSLWSALRGGDTDECKSVLSRAVATFRMSATAIRTTDTRPPLLFLVGAFAAAQRRMSLGVARETLKLLLNSKLGNQSGVRELAKVELFDVPVADGPEGRVNATTLSFGVRPASLLGAMWLQFGEAVARNKQYRACKTPGCPASFEVNPGINRSDRYFCSNACRQRYSRLPKSERKGI